MARLLLAWELGAGAGHAMPLAQLAEVLLDRGHEVHLVWKDLSLGSELPGTLLANPRLHLWQAPVWLSSLQDPAEPASYPELLMRVGYSHPGKLIGCARGWQQLFEVIRPDLLVADHSPTALLVARDTPIRVAMFGNGFCIPPAHSPMPAFRDWHAVDARRLADAEALVLASCNEVLAALGKVPIGALRELLIVDEYFLLGWPELDHLQGLRGDRPLPSWGWPPPPRMEAPPPTPLAPAGRRLLVYLRRDHPAIDAVEAVLRGGPWTSLVHLAGGGAPADRARNDGYMMIAERMIDLPLALADADLMVSHAGSGTLYAALQAGVPTLMLPMQAEQLLLARRVASCGAGVVMWPGEVGARLADALRAMLGSPGFAVAARCLAQRHRVASCDVLQRIAARCEALSVRGR